MAGLLRFVLVTVAMTLVYMLVRVVLSSMRRSAARGEATMPYCQKCESNRNVVVNAGQSPDQERRWYCTHCREGF